MAPLDSLTDEKLIEFFHCKKTEISSYIEEPLTFLNQLRDHDLVPEDLYQKVKKMKNKQRKQEGVYEILDWVENKQGQHVRKFWRCVFENHMLQKYSKLCRLKKRLLVGSKKLPNPETPSSNTEVERNKKKQEQNKSATKRKKPVEETDEEEPGPSSVCSQKKPATKPPLCNIQIAINLPDAETPSSNTEVERKKKKKEQKKSATKSKKSGKETHEKEPGPSSVLNQKKPAMKPSLCSSKIPKKLPKAEELRSNIKFKSKERKQAQKKGATKKRGEETHKMEPGPSSVSSRKKLAMNPKLSKHLKKGELPVICGNKEGTLYKDKLAGGKECIMSEGVWFTPGDFERFSGKENSKNWKLSIRCENITLHKLIQAGELQCRFMKVKKKEDFL